MATLRDIRRRISGVKSTQKITKAMKMVATAKLRRAQERIVLARPYADKMKEILLRLAATTDIEKSLYFEKRKCSTTEEITDTDDELGTASIEELKKVAVIVVTADRGLCGTFNANIIRKAVQSIKSKLADLQVRGDVKLIIIGKKANDFFSKPSYSIAHRHPGVFAHLQPAKARLITREALEGFLHGEIDVDGFHHFDYERVYVIYNRFKSIVQQKVITEQLLPIVIPSDSSEKTEEIPTSQLDYLGRKLDEQLLSTLVQYYLNCQLWRVLLESNAAEQGARMTAMENATTNATDLIRSLQLSYNKARQASITKELLEIVGGAEALQET
jgi:F-type H+-transporting ATPase subunit gamma